MAHIKLQSPRGAAGMTNELFKLIDGGRSSPSSNEKKGLFSSFWKKPKLGKLGMRNEFEHQALDGPSYSNESENTETENNSGEVRDTWNRVDKRDDDDTWGFDTNVTREEPQSRDNSFPPLPPAGQPKASLNKTETRDSSHTRQHNPKVLVKRTPKKKEKNGKPKDFSLTQMISQSFDSEAAEDMISINSQSFSFSEPPTEYTQLDFSGEATKLVRQADGYQEVHRSPKTVEVDQWPQSIVVDEQSQDIKVDECENAGGHGEDENIGCKSEDEKLTDTLESTIATGADVEIDSKIPSFKDRLAFYKTRSNTNTRPISPQNASEKVAKPPSYETNEVGRKGPLNVRADNGPDVVKTIEDMRVTSAYHKRNPNHPDDHDSSIQDRIKKFQPGTHLGPSGNGEQVSSPVCATAPMPNPVQRGSLETPNVTRPWKNVSSGQDRRSWSEDKRLSSSSVHSNEARKTTGVAAPVKSWSFVHSTQTGTMSRVAAPLKSSSSVHLNETEKLSGVAAPLKKFARPMLSSVRSRSTDEESVSPVSTMMKPGLSSMPTLAQRKAALLSSGSFDSSDKAHLESVENRQHQDKRQSGNKSLRLSDTSKDAISIEGTTTGGKRISIVRQAGLPTPKSECSNHLPKPVGNKVLDFKGASLGRRKLNSLGGKVKALRGSLENADQNLSPSSVQPAPKSECSNHVPKPVGNEVLDFKGASLGRRKLNSLGGKVKTLRGSLENADQDLSPSSVQPAASIAPTDLYSVERLKKTAKHNLRPAPQDRHKATVSESQKQKLRTENKATQAMPLDKPTQSAAKKVPVGLPKPTDLVESKSKATGSKSHEFFATNRKSSGSVVSIVDRKKAFMSSLEEPMEPTDVLFTNTSKNGVSNTSNRNLATRMMSKTSKPSVAVQENDSSRSENNLPETIESCTADDEPLSVADRMRAFGSKITAPSAAKENDSSRSEKPLPEKIGADAPGPFSLAERMRAFGSTINDEHPRRSKASISTSLAAQSVGTDKGSITIEQPSKPVVEAERNPQVSAIKGPLAIFAYQNKDSPNVSKPSHSTCTNENLTVRRSLSLNNAKSSTPRNSMISYTPRSSTALNEINVVNKPSPAHVEREREVKNRKPSQSASIDPGMTRELKSSSTGGQLKSIADRLNVFGSTLASKTSIFGLSASEQPDSLSPQIKPRPCTSTSEMIQSVPLGNKQSLFEDDIENNDLSMHFDPEKDGPTTEGFASTLRFFKTKSSSALLDEKISVVDDPSATSTKVGAAQRLFKDGDHPLYVVVDGTCTASECLSPSPRMLERKIVCEPGNGASYFERFQLQTSDGPSPGKDDPPKLPPVWSKRNPVDLEKIEQGSGTVERYQSVKSRFSQKTLPWRQQNAAGRYLEERKKHPVCSDSPTQPDRPCPIRLPRNSELFCPISNSPVTRSAPVATPTTNNCPASFQSPFGTPVNGYNYGNNSTPM